MTKLLSLLITSALIWFPTTPVKAQFLASTKITLCQNPEKSVTVEVTAGPLTRLGSFAKIQLTKGDETSIFEDVEVKQLPLTLGFTGTQYDFKNDVLQVHLELKTKHVVACPRCGPVMPEIEQPVQTITKGLLQLKEEEPILLTCENIVTVSTEN